MPRAPTLRLGCHNVNGMAAKLEGLLQQWEDLGLDVVAAVDTHVSFFDRPELEHVLHTSGWHSRWCLGIQQGGQCRAGVTVLVRSSLLASGRLQISGEPVVASGPGAGRLLMVPITWGSQKLNVVGVYIHASSYEQNVDIIEDLSLIHISQGIVR